MSDIFTSRRRTNPDRHTEIIDRTITHFTDTQPDWPVNAKKKD